MPLMDILQVNGYLGYQSCLRAGTGTWFGSIGSTGALLRGPRCYNDIASATRWIVTQHDSTCMLILENR